MEIDPREKLQSIIDKQLQRLEAKEVPTLNEAITLIAIEYATWHTMLNVEPLKDQLRNFLPKHCAHGWDEVKFCPVRNGNGNECIYCAD